MAKSCVVKAGYTSAYPDPLRLKTGDEVSVEDRPSEWPGWLWCRAESGNEGWAPQAYLSRNGTRAKFNRDYDATELTVLMGQTLTVLEEESGWLRCETQSGVRGWVPARCVEFRESE